MNTSQLTSILIGFLSIILLLYFGKDVLIPLSYSLLIACILYPVCKWLEQKGMSSIAAISVSLLLMMVAGGGLLAFLITQVLSFGREWSQVQVKLLQTRESISLWLTEHLNISLDSQQSWMSDLQSNYGNDVLPLLKTTAGNLSILVVMLVLIPLMAGLMLYERKRLMQVLHLWMPQLPLPELRTILSETVTTYYRFIKGMLVVYLCVGILNSVGLLLLGVPHAILFGCLAAILTFIPYVGIMIGASLPIMVSWITFDSIYYPLGVVAIFTFVQYLEANVIFPWAVSSKLNVNTLMTIVAILAGGVLWGSSGMILFIPFIGILKLIADRIPGWEPIALLLAGSEPKAKT
jgi:predicted PurR-regulated permease PerM